MNHNDCTSLGISGQRPRYFYEIGNVKRFYWGLFVKGIIEDNPGIGIEIDAGKMFYILKHLTLDVGGGISVSASSVLPQLRFRFGYRR